MKQKMNPGSWIALAIFTAVAWAFVGPWALLIAVLGIAMHLALYEDTIRKRNARKMRRELKMEHRMDLAAEYAKRHPNKAP